MDYINELNNIWLRSLAEAKDIKNKSKVNVIKNKLENDDNGENEKELKEKSYDTLIFANASCIFAEHLKDIYGDVILVLVKSGQFYECHGKRDGNNLIGCDYNEISKILNYRLCKQANGYEFCGIPESRITDMSAITRLTNNGWVCIRLDQDEDDKESRHVVGVYTSGTELSDTSNGISMIMYFEQIPGGKGKIAVGIAIINIFSNEINLFEFISTNENNIYLYNSITELIILYQPKVIYSVLKGCKIPLDKLEKYLGIQDETSSVETNMMIEYEKYIELEDAKHILNYNYHESLFEQLYGNIYEGSKHSIIDRMELKDNRLMRIALIIGLRYISGCNIEFINKLKKPIINNGGNLSLKNKGTKTLLMNNAIHQLNLIHGASNQQICKSSTKNGYINKSLYDILNTTKTNGGSRLLKQLLLNPTCDSMELSRRYDNIDNLMIDNRWKLIEKKMSKLPDLELIYRQLELGNRTSIQLYKKIYSAYKIIYEIIDITDHFSLKINNISKEELENIINYCDTYINEIECSSFESVNEITKNIFEGEYGNDLIELDNKIKNGEYIFEKIINELNILIGKKELKEKKEKNEKKSKKTKIDVNKIIFTNEIPEINTENNYENNSESNNIQSFIKVLINQIDKESESKLLCLTKVRFEKLIKELKKTPIIINEIMNDEITNETTNETINNNMNTITITSDDIMLVKESQKNVIIFTLPIIETITKDTIGYSKQLSEMSSMLYENFIDAILENFHEEMIKLHKFIAELDVYISGAKNASEYNYHRPILSEDNSSCTPSYVCAINMRNPISEHIHAVEYKPMSIAVGCELDNEIENNTSIPHGQGIILYGVNSSGKSSLMRSVGLNVIMAQAGMFVPCEQMKLKPYEQIMTRITKGDNEYKGHSLFDVEILELVAIERRYNNRSLILGDEVLSSTNVKEAVSMTTAMIGQFMTAKSSFIFTTHYHELMENREIKYYMKNNLGIYNIKITIENDKINSRVLEKGSGRTLYGIEIAKSAGMSEKFIAKSLEILNETDGKNLFSSTPSRYNKDKILTICEKCKKNPAVETNHKIPQYLFKNDYCGSLYIHNISNLEGVCKECHKEITKMQMTLKKEMEREDCASSRRTLHDFASQNH